MYFYGSCHLLPNCQFKVIAINREVEQFSLSAEFLPLLWIFAKQQQKNITEKVN